MLVFHVSVLLHIPLVLMLFGVLYFSEWPTGSTSLKQEYTEFYIIFDKYAL
jgi:hypothetical protein